MSGETYVFHVDVNGAYLSWSAAYRTCILGETTDLRDIPSIVGGDPATRHGIVLAKSIPAGRFGIATGEPLCSARRKCPDLVVIPPDYGLYVTASRALIKLLRRYSDRVIQYSIDEAWVVFDGFGRIYGRDQMVSLAFQMKEEIRETLGFTVNIGVSTNLLLAKMAGEFSKPDRVHTLFEEEIPGKLWPLPISELFMAGPAMSARLRRLGIRTIGELARAEEAFIRTQLKRPGLILQGYARGRELEPYVFTHEANQGYGNSMTAPRDVRTGEYARSILLSLCETVGTRLRQDQVRAGLLSVQITTCEFEHFSRQEMLLTATDLTEELYEAACRVFERLWDGRTPVRQIGVHTAKIQKGRERQCHLFDTEKRERLERLGRAVDDIRKKYGEDSIMRASFLKNGLPHMGGGLDRERRSGVTLGIDIENEIAVCGGVRRD